MLRKRDGIVSTSSDILLVEDDIVVADVLCRMLVRAAYTVRTAKDGAAALIELEQQLPSVLILDLNLPGKSGFMVLEEMHRHRMSVPIIIITANPLFQASLHHNDITRVLIKPFPIEELLAALRDHAKGRIGHTMSDLRGR
jgi:DNA-binding response OmpR family regulator